MTEVATRVRFARECVDDVLEEIQPLLKEHWAEIAQYPDIPLDPDFFQYRRAERAQQLRIFTARKDELIGYAIYILAPALHYRSSLQAKQDVLYLKPAHRAGRIGWRLIEFADEQLRKDRVQIVHQHVKWNHNFGPLLDRIGYGLSEYIYSRRLD